MLGKQGRHLAYQRLAWLAQMLLILGAVGIEPRLVVVLLQPMQELEGFCAKSFKRNRRRRIGKEIVHCGKWLLKVSENWETAPCNYQPRSVSFGPCGERGGEVVLLAFGTGWFPQCVNRQQPILQTNGTPDYASYLATSSLILFLRHDRGNPVRGDPVQLHLPRRSILGEVCNPCKELSEEGARPQGPAAAARQTITPATAGQAIRLLTPITGGRVPLSEARRR